MPANRTKIDYQKVVEEAQRELDEVMQAVGSDLNEAEAPAASPAPAAAVAGECPACGKIFDGERACPVDGSPLRAVGAWEPVVETQDPGAVAERAGRHYPTQER